MSGVVVCDVNAAPCNVDRETHREKRLEFAVLGD